MQHASPLVQISLMGRARTNLDNISDFLARYQWNEKLLSFSTIQLIAKEVFQTRLELAKLSTLPVLNLKLSPRKHVLLINQQLSPIWQSYHATKLLCRHAGIKRPLAQAFGVCAVIPRPLFHQMHAWPPEYRGIPPELLTFRRHVGQIYEW